jgi:multiple sugar transport system permease protein
MLKQQRARLAYYLILPSLVLITLLNLAPLIDGVVVSLQSQNMLRPDPTAFVGLEHYRRALIDEASFWPSLAKTLIWTAGAVAGGYVLGLALALLMNLDLKGRSFFRALLLIPWVIPDVCTALLWKWLYGDEFGVINFLLAKFGIIHQPVLWLSSPNMAMAAVIFVQVWKLYPVMFIVLLAALQSVPRDIYEAAMIDGAGAWRRLLSVTMPLIRPTSVIITLLAAIWTFQNFDIIYLLTGGGPADATKTLATFIYETAFWATDIGYATALGILMLLCLLLFTIVYLLVYRAQQRVPA